MSVRSAFLLCVLISWCPAYGVQEASTVGVLSPDNWDDLIPVGKEVDCIYGDYVLRNDRVVAVIAQPLPTRNANMTVRGVGGQLIDLTTTSSGSDQLSCYYAGGRGVSYQSAEIIEVPGGVAVRVTGALAGKPTVTTTWTLRDGADWLEAETVWQASDKAVPVNIQDQIRADGGKEDMLKAPNGEAGSFWIHDIYWQQAYLVAAEEQQIRANSNARESTINYEQDGLSREELGAGETARVLRRIFPGRDLPEARGRMADFRGQQAPVKTLILQSETGERVPGGRIVLTSDDGYYGAVVTGENGMVQVPLPVATYSVTLAAGGQISASASLDITNDPKPITLSVKGYRPGVVSVKVTDESGQPVPAKIAVAGSGQTPTPNWGPESASFFVRNLAYAPHGVTAFPLTAGEYNLIVSRGPEYDAAFLTVRVEAGKSAEQSVVLNRVVDTLGWVSADFHSHSSPSGDNTGSQLGRLLNLVCEHVEFAPCTEHNRVDSYEPLITQYQLGPWLATETGMELTGQPLPLNHQNVFPMVWTPRTQDGGGPVTDGSPETQIERLAAWDNRSEKLIQQNHPDIGWLFYDKNGDGQADDGYERSLPLIDVMEIHPIDRILDPQPFEMNDGKPTANQRVFRWLQLLNQGFRIPGVVNTDAHYNYHGSGGLRNWIQSSADEPAQIDSDEMVQASKEGRLVMSNGPYLSVQFASGGATAVAGQDIAVTGGTVSASIRVQCPNWMDIDTVFVLVNGRPVPGLSFSREKNGYAFRDGVVRFEETVEIELDSDAHLIVVTGHSTDVLGPVFGPSWGNQHPAALTNPVYADVDGNGFEPNKDTLDEPLPVKLSR